MEQERWSVIAEFLGSNTDALAEMVVERLRAHGIEAARLPAEKPDTGAIRVAVHLEHAGEARALLRGLDEAEPMEEDA